MPPYLWRLFKSLYRELGWNDNHIENFSWTEDDGWYWFFGVHCVLNGHSARAFLVFQELFWFNAFPIVIARTKPWCSFATLCSIFDHDASWKWASKVWCNHQHRYRKILQQKNSKAWEQRIKSHPPKWMSRHFFCSSNFPKWFVISH